MSSQINPQLIDGTFPVAGVNNNSQGFRDNFTGTSDNFTIAAREINDLMNKVVVTSALTYGNASVVNNFNGSLITQANLTGCTLAVVSHGTVTASSQIETFDFNAGSFHTITLNSSTPGSTLTVLPANPAPAVTPIGYAQILMQVTVSNVDHQLDFVGLGTIYVHNVPGFNSATNILTFAKTGTYLLSLGTVDGNNWNLSSFPNFISYNKTPATSVGAPGDAAGTLVYDTNYLYVCTSDYNGSSNIWGRTGITLSGW